MKAIDMTDRTSMNIRYTKASQLASWLMRTLDDHLPRASRSEAYAKIMEFLMTEGLEILTDEDRNRAGLPPRGPNGWTHAELLALEYARLHAISAPFAVAVKEAQASGITEKTPTGSLEAFIDIAEVFQQIEEAFGFAPGTFEVTLPRDDFIKFQVHPIFGQMLEYNDPKRSYGDTQTQVAGRIYRPRPIAEQTSDKPSDIAMSDGRKPVGKASENSALDTDIFGKNGG